MAKLVTRARMHIEGAWRAAGHIFDGDPEEYAGNLESGTVEEYDPDKHGEIVDEEEEAAKAAHPAAPSAPAEPPAPSTDAKKADGGAK